MVPPVFQLPRFFGTLMYQHWRHHHSKVKHMNTQQQQETPAWVQCKKCGTIIGPTSKTKATLCRECQRRQA